MQNSVDKFLMALQMVVERHRLKQAGRTLLFSNGCFDVLHAGHVNHLDFYRDQDATSKVRKMLTDSALRDRLVEKSNKCGDSFSWERNTRKTIAAQ